MLKPTGVNLMYIVRSLQDIFLELLYNWLIISNICMFSYWIRKVEKISCFKLKSCPSSTQSVQSCCNHQSMWDCTFIVDAAIGVFLTCHQGFHFFLFHLFTWWNKTLSSKRKPENIFNIPLWVISFGLLETITSWRIETKPFLFSSQKVINKLFLNKWLKCTLYTWSSKLYPVRATMLHITYSLPII